MFTHRNIHKYTGMSAHEKTRSKIDHVLKDRRRHASALDAQYFILF